MQPLVPSPTLCEEGHEEGFAAAIGLFRDALAVARVLVCIAGSDSRSMPVAANGSVLRVAALLVLSPVDAFGVWWSVGRSVLATLAAVGVPMEATRTGR
jgi:hypothetical protein